MSEDASEAWGSSSALLLGELPVLRITGAVSEAVLVAADADPVEVESARMRAEFGAEVARRAHLETAVETALESDWFGVLLRIEAVVMTKQRAAEVVRQAFDAGFAAGAAKGRAQG